MVVSGVDVVAKLWQALVDAYNRLVGICKT